MFSNSNCASVPLVANIDGNNNNAWGGDCAWLIWMVLIFAIFGYGGFGFGGFGGMGGANSPGLQGIATRADINEGFALNDIQNGIRGIQQGICDSVYALNNTMQGGFNGVNVAMLQGFNGVQQAINADTVANMQNTNALQTQLANCCCENREGQAQIRYDMATQACETRQAIADSTRQVLDFLTQDKIATLTAENQNLKFQASQTAQNAYITANQEAQTAELVRRLGRDYPVNAVVVQPNTPVTFPVNGCGNFTGYNSCNGCGC